MLKFNISRSVFLLVALSAVGQASAGKVVGSGTDRDSISNDRHLMGGKGKGKGMSRSSKGSNGSKGKGKGKGGSSYGSSYGYQYGYDSGYGYGKGKGKGGYDSGYGYGKGKGKGGYGYGTQSPSPSTPSPPFPSPTPPTFPSSPPAPSPGCIQQSFDTDFLFLSANLAIPPTTTDPLELGTTFIYEPSPTFNATEFIDNGATVELEGEQITGVCTRTLSTLDSDTGGGVCQFTLQMDGGSVTFGGFIEDYVEGDVPPTLVISGGSGEQVGITGEVALLPLDVNGDVFTGDVFFDAFGYQAFAFGLVLVCDVVEGF